MAEKQFALGGTRSIGFQEEDDPLAELARIVGFQEPSASRSQPLAEERKEPVITEFPVSPAQAASPAAAGQNPVADLEDELLRAFETYDGPRAQEHAASVPEPVAEMPRPVSVPQVNAVRDEDEDPFAALAAVVAQSAVVNRPSPVVQQAPGRPAEPVFAEPAPAPVEAAAEPQVDFSVEMLEAELMQSLDEAELDWGSVAPEPARAAPERQISPVVAPAVTARTDFRMPLANFHTPKPAAPVVPAETRQEPVAWDLPGMPAEAPAETVEPKAAPVSASPAEIYPEPVRQVAAAPAEPALDPFDLPVSASTVGDEPDFDDLFKAGEFELDLDDFERQLKQFSSSEQVREPAVSQPAAPHRAFADFVPEAAVAPVAAEPKRVPERQEPLFADEPLRRSAPLNTVESAAPVAMEPPAPVTSFAASPAMEAFDTDNGVFDPALLAEADDPIEAVEDFDVPEIKMPEPEEPAVVVPDYDLDIDAEMANLFSSLPPLGAAPAERKPSVESAAPRAVKPPMAEAAPAVSMTVDSFEDFERALEDDFRQMLSQPLGRSQDVGGRAEPQLLQVSPPRNNNFRSILLAACATGAVALVGLGGYFMLSGKAGVMSGEPKVILADKGPVKVVPENKGGVTVPNQDKAVYDRVAGNGDETVKQGALITSEEEPVDVVQKTLMPESDDGAMAETPAVGTPVEDTKDARLLPAAEKPENPDAVANPPGGVQVRKVRTMIVKADGTLVPREEEPAPAPQVDVANDTNPAPAPETTAAVPQSRLAAPQDAAPAATDATADVLAKVANTDVPVAAEASDVPVKTVKTTMPSDAAPVPTARPSDQPVNVVGTVTENGKVKAGQADAPQETASVDPASSAQPVAAPASGSYGIQIASLPTEADAKASIGKMSAKFGSVLGGRPIGIRQANIPNKGTYYRLRVDVGSKDQAIALCGKLKAAGGSCLVSK